MDKFLRECQKRKSDIENLEKPRKVKIGSLRKRKENEYGKIIIYI